MLALDRCFQKWTKRSRNVRNLGMLTTTPHLDTGTTPGSFTVAHDRQGKEWSTSHTSWYPILSFLNGVLLEIPES